MTYHTDLWQCGIVKAPIARFLQPMQSKPPTFWLPPPLADFCFVADPFGIWRDEYLFVFAEAYDYRSKIGHIKGFAYTRDLIFLEEFDALIEPWHLSYAFLIEENGETYMLPEAHRSGALHLYRAERFPYEWQRCATLLDQPAIDASLIHYENRWWLFYALPQAPLSQLHIAYADQLTGPWKPHAGNPVRDSLSDARPGGTPFVREGKLYLPVQDGSVSYGGALHILRIDELTPDRFSAENTAHLSPEGWHADYPAGLHTLSAAGDYTLIDLKRIETSPKRRWIDWQRRLRRLTGQR